MKTQSEFSQFAESIPSSFLARHAAEIAGYGDFARPGPANTPTSHVMAVLASPSNHLQGQPPMLPSPPPELLPVANSGNTSLAVLGPIARLAPLGGGVSSTPVQAPTTGAWNIANQHPTGNPPMSGLETIQSGRPTASVPVEHNGPMSNISIPEQMWGGSPPMSGLETLQSGR
ncbi:MAG: hypothetical protein ACP5EP_12300, partial [Acidobacteriaceae bacterium]